MRRGLGYKMDPMVSYFQFWSPKIWMIKQTVLTQNRKIQQGQFIPKSNNRLRLQRGSIEVNCGHNQPEEANFVLQILSSTILASKFAYSPPLMPPKNKDLFSLFFLPQALIVLLAPTSILLGPNSLLFFLTFQKPFLIGDKMVCLHSLCLFATPIYYGYY